MLPLGPTTVITATTATLNLGTAILQLVKAAEKEGRKISADEVLYELINTTLKTANSQTHALRDLKQRFIKLNIDLTKSLSEIEQDVSWWRLRKYYAVRAYKRYSDAAVNILSDTYQDIIALAQCREAEDLIPMTSVAALQASQSLRSQLGEDPAVGQMLDILIAKSETLASQLSDIQRRPA